MENSVLLGRDVAGGLGKFVAESVVLLLLLLGLLLERVCSSALESGEEVIKRSQLRRPSTQSERCCIRTNLSEVLLLDVSTAAASLGLGRSKKRNEACQPLLIDMLILASILIPLTPFLSATSSSWVLIRSRMSE